MVERPRTLLAVLIVCDLGLVALYLLSNWTGSWALEQWFHINSEVSVPTWFSSSKLLLAALFVFLSAVHARDVGVSSSFLFLVAFGLLFISADETAQIHEKLTAISATHLPFIPLFEGHGAWITIYGTIGLILVGANIRNIADMWKGHRRAFLTFVSGFATLVLGAVLVEMAGYYGLFALAAAQLSLEEGLEMIGGSVIVVSSVILFRDFAGSRAGEAGAARGAFPGD